MRISRTHGVQALAAAGLIGAAILAPAVASATTTASPATPTNCTKWTSDQFMWAQCTSGTGKYRIHGECVKVDDPSSYYLVNGPYVAVPKKSEAGCPVATYPVALSVQKQ